MERNVSRARYLLRYALPYWNAEKRILELADFCRETGIDDVVFFTGGGKKLGSATHVLGFETIKEAKKYAEVLGLAMARLRDTNVGSSINVWCTIGHGDYGQDLRKVFPFQFQVDADGTESRACACPLDPAWKRHMKEIYRIYALLRPKIIFVDDDFRFHNHPPVRWGCFCPLHLEAFSKRMGRTLSREKIVKAVLSPGPQPTPERRHWLSLLGDSLIEAAAILEQTVHDTSPETRLGLMSSSPEAHNVEGRRWIELLKALCGPYPPVVRPTLGNYVEGDKRTLLRGLSSTLQTKALTPANTLICPEIENYPFTRFSKSSRFTWLQMALCQLHMISDITLDLYDFLGGPLNEEPIYGNMLRESKIFFDAIAKLTSGGVVQGIQLFLHEGESLFRRMSGGGWGELAARRPWDFTLPLLGFSITYNKSSICAISGDSILTLNDGEIKNLLKKGAILDAEAASAIGERGFTELVGVSVGEKMFNCFLEDLTEEDFGRRTGEDHTFLATPDPGMGWLRRLRPLPGAKAVSRILTNDGSELGPGLTMFENQLGGRIAVLPYEGRSGSMESVFFRNWRRQTQLKAVLHWLGRGAVPLFVEDAPDIVPVRIDKLGHVVIAVANLSSDLIPRLKTFIGGLRDTRYKISSLTEKGKFKSLSKVYLKEEKAGCIFQPSISIEPLSLGILVLEERR